MCSTTFNPPDNIIRNFDLQLCTCLSLNM